MKGGLNSYNGAAQASKAHVMRVKCNLLSNKRVGVMLQVTVVRNEKKILRSAKATCKYHYILPFSYKINKEDLPLMYSCVFW